MFCSIYDFTFLMIDTKIKGQVSFESSEEKKLVSAHFSVKIVILPVQSITLENWFAWMPACTSAIVWVSLTSLNTLAILSDTTLRRCAVNQEKQKHTENQKKGQISLGDQQSYYLQVFERLY